MIAPGEPVFAFMVSAEQFLQGLFLGGLAMLWATNMVLLLMLRDRAYLFLTILIAGAMLLVGSRGSLFAVLQIGSAPALGLGLIVIGLVGYLRHLLETPVLAPRLDKGMLLLAGLVLLFLCSGLVVPVEIFAATARTLGLPALLVGIALVFAVGSTAIGWNRPAGRLYIVGALLLAGSLGAAAVDLTIDASFDPAGTRASLRGPLQLAGASGGLLLIAVMTTGVHFKIKLLRDELQQLNLRTASSGSPSGAADGANSNPSATLEPDASPDASSSPWNIGPRMEQKLQQALFYLKENFRSDISREGLAAQLGLNPDNLGRFFLMYTGEKLGDYINQLRIAAAARRLHESDQQIQAIAQDVGFDNISTFNRVFKKAMGQTPRAYREQLRRAAPG